MRIANHCTNDWKVFYFLSVLGASVRLRGMLAIELNEPFREVITRSPTSSTVTIND